MRARILCDPAPGGAGGGGTPPPAANWRDTLPPEYRADAALADVPDVPTLAKNYINTKALVGRSIAIPGERATPEERAQFYTKLGRPEKPELYEEPKGFTPHPALNVDKAQMDTFRKSFHDLGLSKQQGDILIKQYLETMNGNVAAMAKAREDETTATMGQLEKDWGVNKDANVKLALQAVEKFGGPELKKFFDESGLGNNPHLIKMFHKIGTMIGEDRSGGGESRFQTVDSASALAEIAKLGKDAAFIGALYNKNDPKHEETVKRWQELHAVAHPGKINET